MSGEMAQSMLELVINGLPNFVGFVILSYVMWRIITKQLELLERVLIDCLEDDNNNRSDGISPPPPPKE